MKFFASLFNTVKALVSHFFLVSIPGVFHKVKALVRRYSNKRTAFAIGVVALLIFIAILRVVFSAGAIEDDEVSTRQVQVAPAGTIGDFSTILEVTGEIKSTTQGDLRTQSAGVITSVNGRIGQRVGAGYIVASIENAAQRASVAQAQASVAQAQANLNKVSGGTRDEQLAVLNATTRNATQALEEAEVSVRNTLLSAYTATDSIFAGGVDAMFSDADGANPKLSFVSTKNSQSIAAEHGRFVLQAIIDRHVQATARVGILDAQALRAEITTVEGEMLKIKTTLDNVITALDGAVVSGSVTSATITSYKVTATTARSSALSTLSTLSTARGAINSAQSALEIAKENQEQGITGAQKEDVQVVQAQLDSANAGLASAYAALEKTRVRAPVSGTITLLSVEKGDFVASFQDVGLVANEGALEVQAYVSESVVKRLSVGTRAVIAGIHGGIITSISPGIDPTTRQVEVRVAVTDSKAALTNGSRVSVVFSEKKEDVTQTEGAPMVIRIPISALKLIGSNAFVFTVSDEFKVVSHPVTLGEVIQNSVEILEGITADELIITDARGLNKGDSVSFVSN